EDYGSSRLYRVTDAALGALPEAARDGARVANEMDVIQLDAYPLDTRAGAVRIPPHLMAPATSASTLHLVQFVGPIKQAWLDELQQLGVQPVHYVESNAYLVWTDGAAREALGRLVTKGDFLQYSGPYHPYYKLGPTLRESLSKPLTEERAVPVTIQVLAHEGKAATHEQIASMSASIDSPLEPVLSYEKVKA